MTEQIKVFKAGLTEVDVVAKLFDHYRIFYKQPSDLEGAKAFIYERLSKQQSVIFLAMDEEENNPLGFVQLYPSYSSVAMKKLWILNDLYVEEAARRRGVARLLMERAKEHAIGTGAKGITLETAADNFNAQRLYEAMGYEKETACIHFNYLIE